MTDFMEYRKFIIAFAVASFCGICIICEMSFKLIDKPLWQVVAFDFVVAAFGLCCICFGAAANKGYQMLKDDGYDIEG